MCFIKKKEKPYQIVSSKKITLLELSNLLKERFPKARIYLSDNEYTLCHYDDVAYFLAINEIDKMSYKKEEFDCDDFATALWGDFSKPPFSGLTIGLVWTNVHALNLVITDDYKILFLEPQTDELNENLADWQGTEVELIIV